MLTFLFKPTRLILPYYDLYEQRRMEERGYDLFRNTENPKNDLHHFIVNWIPVIVWTLIMFYWSSIPDLKSGLSQDFFLRKTAHVSEYFILTFLLFRALKDLRQTSFYFSLLVPVAVALLYAVSDEFHQSFVPNRHGSLQDVLIDFSGILIFYLVVCVWMFGGTHKKNARLVFLAEEEPGRRRIEMDGARFVYSENLPSDETKIFYPANSANFC